MSIKPHYVYAVKTIFKNVVTIKGRIYHSLCKANKYQSGNFEEMKKKRFVVICNDLRSLHNIGSVFRTADGAGIDKIYLCGISGHPDSEKARGKISKVALGAEESTEWEYAKHAWRVVEKLKSGGFEIVSLEQNRDSVDLADYEPKFPVALVIGNENKGVRKSLLEKSDRIIEIPMKGRKESLNVSVAFGIAAYHISEFLKDH